MLFGDQLGPHFLDDPEQPTLLIESRQVFARRRFHRQKAHLILSAMRHRAQDPRCTYIQAATYRDGLAQISGPIEVCHPTSRAALALVQHVAADRQLSVLPARGFSTSADDFSRWVAQRGNRRLLLEDFYRDARRRLAILMDGVEPTGGRWNFDADNRLPPPKNAVSLGVTEPSWPVEDEVDDQVRKDLDSWERAGDVSFIGKDGPRRFAATRAEALARLSDFIQDGLNAFGPHEDAIMAGDRWMAHSLLSAPQNLGLLDPIEIARRAEDAYRNAAAPLASVEGFIRQVIGWRDYIWHLYWHLGPEYAQKNFLRAGRPLPRWFEELDADAVEARCISDVLGNVRDDAWVHHIPRLMVLGNYALQRGWDPAALSDWFHRSFIDGYEWVMAPNVIGMSQHADGGLLATKPYAAGGAYINKMSNYCSGCRYDPKVRLGDHACPFTGGYWWFIARNTDRLNGNHRMAQALAGARRLPDLAAVVAQEEDRGNDAP